MNIKKMNEGLAFLTEKYSVPVGKIFMGADDVVKVQDGAGQETILLPWRVERRFVELKKMVTGKILEGVSTLRFCSITPGGNLRKQLEREFDLAVWLMDVPLKTLFAVCSKDLSAANIVAKLQNDYNFSLECSNKLPQGSEVIDRHEIIARRGVASDRVVDSQVPQSSIYMYNDKGEQRYTDVDSELFGLSTNEIWLVRAAFAVLDKPALSKIWNAAAAQMSVYAKAVFESDQTMLPQSF